MPTVYVGIVTYNSRADLPTCLDGLRAQTYAHMQIVVVDNASADDTVDWLRTNAPDIQMIQNTQNSGFGRAHNQIVQHCALTADDFYLALNPDVRLEPDYIRALVDALQTHRAGWGTGKLRLWTEDPDEARLYSVGHALLRGGYALNIGHEMVDTGQFDTPREVFGVPGAAALYTGRLIAQIAADGTLFDPVMFMYGEDTDLDWRARRAGFTCWYTPHAVATHRGSQANRALRVEALTNRYLSVLKNACWIDMLSYNLPLLLLHMAVRVLLTPREGLRILWRMLRLGPLMLRQRTTPTVNRAIMNDWFRWGAAQATAQPRGMAARWRAFRSRHREE